MKGRAGKRGPRSRVEADARVDGGEIAHEVNNLLMGLVGCAEVAVTRLDQGALEAAREAIVDLREAAKRGASLTDRLPVTKEQGPDRGVDVDLGVVLVVDDDPLVRRAIRHMLEGRAAEIVEAADGEEALALLGAERRIDLLLCDISLPGLQGGEVVRRSIATVPDLAAICMSSKPHALLLAEGSVDPEVSFVQKPFALEDLAALLPSAKTRRREASRTGRAVLLVEDDELMRTALRALVESWRLSVHEATSVASALEVLDGEACDVGVVLSDLVLEGASGDVLVRTLRRRGDGLPVVFMTGLRPEDPLVVRALAPPGTRLLRKPFDAEALRDVLFEHVAEGRSDAAVS